MTPGSTRLDESLTTLRDAWARAVAGKRTRPISRRATCIPSSNRSRRRTRQSVQRVYAPPRRRKRPERVLCTAHSGTSRWTTANDGRRPEDCVVNRYSVSMTRGRRVAMSGDRRSRHGRSLRVARLACSFRLRPHSRPMRPWISGRTAICCGWHRRGSSRAPFGR